MNKLKIADNVIINYEKLEENYIKMIKDNTKLYASFNTNLALVHMSNEIEDMRKFDMLNGKTRTIKSIAYGKFYDAKITRYTLDNDYVFYIDELIKK